LDLPNVTDFLRCMDNLFHSAQCCLKTVLVTVDSRQQIGGGIDQVEETMKAELPEVDFELLSRSQSDHALRANRRQVLLQMVGIPRPRYTNAQQQQPYEYRRRCDLDQDSTVHTGLQHNRGIPKISYGSAVP